MGDLIAVHRPDIVVIACATASTIALPDLRARFAVRFVGTVPAIKPACAGSATRRVSVLGTEGTVQREYTRALIREYAGGCEVTLVGSAELAALAEAKLNGEPDRGRGDRCRDRAVLRRRRRRAHRHHRARLHALSAAARRHQPPGAVAGLADRPGARDRAPRGRTDRAAAECRSAGARRGRVHVGPDALAVRRRSARCRSGADAAGASCTLVWRI